RSPRPGGGSAKHEPAWRSGKPSPKGGIRRTTKRANEMQTPHALRRKPRNSERVSYTIASVPPVPSRPTSIGLRQSNPDSFVLEGGCSCLVRTNNAGLYRERQRRLGR